MKTDNFSYILKGVILAFSGVLVAFFPGVINWLFYIIGGIIVFACILTFLSSVFGGEGGFMLPAGLAGAALGVGIMVLPRFVTIQIPVIVGIILCVMGAIRLAKGLAGNDDKKMTDIILGLLFIAGGVVLVMNPFQAGKALRIMSGLIMIGFAVFNFYIAYVIKQRNEAFAPSVIDVDNYTVEDEKKHLQ